MLMTRMNAIALAVSSLALLAACGGGSSSPETQAGGGTVTLRGVAATGAPLVGSQVAFYCAAGQPAAATTGADGAWTASGTGITFPCAIQVSGGTLGNADGPANTMSLYSTATAAGEVNVTTLTTMMLLMLTEQEPAKWFAQLGSSKAALAGVSNASLSAALGKLKAMLAALPTPVDLPADFDPIKTPLKAVLTDTHDQLLEKLSAALAAGNVSFDEVAANLLAGAPAVGKTPASLTLEKLTDFGSGIVGGSEIPAYDPASKRMFVVNGSGLGSVEVWNLADPANPVKAANDLQASDYGARFGGINSVAIHNGIVALAIEAKPKTDNGIVVFLKADTLLEISRVDVGALPDMVTFSPDGRHALAANEGEPNSYNAADSVDPEGSVSIIDIQNIRKPVAHTADFKAFNGQEATLRAAKVRLYGPNASVAQDLEPEYITVSHDSRKAYVTLQENNAYAVIDIASRKVESIKGFGYKDHSLPGMGMDISDEDGGVNTNSGNPTVKIEPVLVRGLYMPDAVASYAIGGKTYLVTANEGDAREWGDEDKDPHFYIDEARVKDHCKANGLDPAVFGANVADLIKDSNYGRLKVTKFPNGDTAGKNGAGQCSELYAYGARSFSIWDAQTGARVYDSGDGFEQKTAALAGTPGYSFYFNMGHDKDHTLDGRSASKGPEPEGVVVHRFGEKVFAFVGLERVGGVMVYDITDPAAAKFETYINTRNYGSGDLGPEGLIVIPAAKSPNGKPLLAVGHEVSGKTVLYNINLTH